MWIGLLGSLQVRVEGAAVAVPAARQRALLAVLAVRAGELVPTDELAEIVWDGKPPDREFGDRYCQATVLAHLGDTRHTAGQDELARGAWQEAVAILDALHHPYAGTVRARLRQNAEPSLARRPQG